MFELGRIHTLTVDHVDGRGAWLQAGDQQVLLPKKEVPPTVRPGDRLSVFVYAGPSGQPVATRQRPKAQVGEFASLMAMEIGPAGAFLDWGLEKELLVPFRKQPEPMHAGRFYLVKVCLDREGRAFGNGRIDSCLETEVTGLKGSVRVS
jgi:predicted RNA-binding protein (virulence factor B family)